MRIKTYQTSNQEGILKLIVGIQRNEFGVAITAEDQPDLYTIPEFYQQGNGNFWVAVSEGQIIGTIALLDTGNQQVALRKMFVTENHRGAEHGVAQALLGQAHAWVIKQGVTDIYLGTIDVYQAAMRFYEKHGYVRIKKASLPNTFPLIAVDNFFYHKKF